MPKTVEEFFCIHQGRKRQKSSVRNFHDWLRRNKISLSKLTPEHLEAYLQQPAQKEIKESSQKRLYADLKPYLAWLYAQKHLSFTPKGKARKLHPLPPSAVEYINTLKPVQKESTWRGHVCHLRAFHAWLAQGNLPLSEIDRKHMEQWLQHLSQRGLSATTRRHQIFNVGVYLRWLFEKEIIDAEPRYLLRPFDVPPKPKYLPRPFPPDADREIQQRLAASDDLHHKALLLMRCTGLRIGELSRLTPDCLEKDHLGNASLKVPLGKLDNERLVPLDANTRKLLENLQSQCPPNVEFLLKPELSRAHLQSSISKALKGIALDLDTHGSVVSHRLRHTYATELMNAGMSLYGIMRLLGHHGIEMTMRYAALTQNTVTRDYHQAIEKIESQYRPAHQTDQEPNPDRMLLDTIAWIRKNHCSNTQSKRTSDAIIKRVHRIRQDLSKITSAIDHS